MGPYAPLSTPTRTHAQTHTHQQNKMTIIRKSHRQISNERKEFMRRAKQSLRRQIEEKERREAEEASSSSSKSSKSHLSLLKLLLITFTIIGTSFIGSRAYDYAYKQRQNRDLQMIDIDPKTAAAGAILGAGFGLYAVCVTIDTVRWF